MMSTVRRAGRRFQGGRADRADAACSGANSPEVSPRFLFPVRAQRMGNDGSNGGNGIPAFGDETGKGLLQRCQKRGPGIKELVVASFFPVSVSSSPATAAARVEPMASDAAAKIGFRFVVPRRCTLH
jgi:hypothetical protein